MSQYCRPEGVAVGGPVTFVGPPVVRAAAGFFADCACADVTTPIATTQIVKTQIVTTMTKKFLSIQFSWRAITWRARLRSCRFPPARSWEGATLLLSTSPVALY